jgi:hypothetical protein
MYPKYLQKFREYSYQVLIYIMASIMLCSCGALRNSSVHGFNSGYYTLDTGRNKIDVYADITDDSIHIHLKTENRIVETASISSGIKDENATFEQPLRFSKSSIDIDITSVLFKYRPAINNLPGQLTTDMNLAVYVGWRYDFFTLTRTTNPLNKRTVKINTWGYDFGVFAGLGVTPVNPFTTDTKIVTEYSAPVLQTGVAAFIESGIASFGISAGIDHLLDNNSALWVYNRKPWIGFIVGIALN